MKPHSLASAWAPLLGFRLLWVVNASTVPQNSSSWVVPEALCSSFGSYPNPLGITEEDRQSFHPVVKYPTIWVHNETALAEADVNDSTISTKKRVPHVRISDYTKPTDKVHLASEEQILQKRKELAKIPSWFLNLRCLVPSARLFVAKFRKEHGIRHFSVGRYDEDRVGMYISDMFEDLENSVEGYAGARTVHVGVDLGGPVGTKVYAFADGVVHAAGYNSEWGDYGNVVVIEHTVPSNGNKMWALYGHLDKGSIQGKKPGQEISKGQVVGRLGDFTENGGWVAAHVHFQLAIEPPKTHDMPGAVALNDRQRALVQYPDPRWVLGPLY
ncbi:peptidase' [Seminavis robusta]|uniref:Peptidase n=1 Tax=Seminavis robusta TaxID=568900 RepID=A0A9N8D6Y8_9STRA|nr:peptidase' [Seminavis robusta]|eukprot:Sro4_g003400.1 peptidase' (328) ;mRNA; r:139313-140498